MRRWKCAKTDFPNRWTVGKIYQELQNGTIEDDGGCESRIGAVKLTTIFEEVKDFTLADLKPCMVVELRNSDICLVSECNTGIVAIDKYSFLDFNEVLDDLRTAFDRNFDIIKVYGFSTRAIKSTEISTSDRELLWERIEKSPTQLKLEELENKQREIADEIKKIREEME